MAHGNPYAFAISRVNVTSLTADSFMHAPVRSLTAQHVEASTRRWSILLRHTDKDETMDADTAGGTPQSLKKGARSKLSVAIPATENSVRHGREKSIKVLNEMLTNWI